MKEMGDGEQGCKTMSSRHGMTATLTNSLQLQSCPRPRQPIFQWAALIRSNELLKENKEEQEEMKEGTCQAVSGRSGRGDLVCT